MGLRVEPKDGPRATGVDLRVYNLSCTATFWLGVRYMHLLKMAGEPPLDMQLCGCV